MRGIYQHCGEQLLHHYLAEYEVRYENSAKLGFNDQDRVWNALHGIVGKRLTYWGMSRRNESVASQLEPVQLEFPFNAI